jgi:hypothetical protein
MQTIKPFHVVRARRPIVMATPAVGPAPATGVLILLLTIATTATAMLGVVLAAS